MADFFKDGQIDYIQRLNQMYTAFAAGPYNALPLTGGTLSGALYGTLVSANSLQTRALVGAGLQTGGGGQWYKVGRLIGVTPSAGRMVVGGVNGYGAGGATAASAGATVIHFRGENDNVIRGFFYSTTAGNSAVSAVIIDSLKDVYLLLGAFFNGDVQVYGQFGFTPDFQPYGVVAPAGQAMLAQQITAFGSVKSLTITPTTISTPCEFTAARLLPAADNAHDIGSAATAYRTIYARTGTINTSDARLKCDFRDLTAAEIAAAKDIASAIGAYRWRDAVDCKGAAAREHVGPTVQAAIEIMQAHGLDPFNYGFICHDIWEQQTIEHPAIEAQPAIPATEAVPEVRNSFGDVITPGVLASAGFPAVEARTAYTEVTQEAGDRYAFRYDELAMFIAAGQEARLALLEAA
ncbi:tail fiber domain-containing protein [Janthinobacterium sp. PLB04]|uniref:Tail fiber domain-containing protein n=1 Tax=Janthinobacterium lividum TaxID=29581 RepID=A0AAJ4T6W6_9BURK|nr:MULTISPECIES: tail fiber domain-containing protein [Janthinobacterium]KAB0331785.1 tail fiber domain-containing protein [Janthinobacterium lividum]QSX97986.1 tail fiber domain-containing protein [Janthinobacterium lividum]UGQ37956.1 tail fiber domain-containing protein [Janthinobacterium sp. PLB04]